MLKVCWDCLAGDRRENDAYGTTLNRETFRTPWPTSQIQNEIMFRMPKELNLGDKVKISGIRSHERESFAISFMTGGYTPDNENVACKFEAYYDNEEEQLILTSIQNGQKDSSVLDDRPTDYFQDQSFEVSFELRFHENTHLIDIYAGVSFLGTIILQHSLRDITYITLSPGSLKINKLHFTFK